MRHFEATTNEEKQAAVLQILEIALAYVQAHIEPCEVTVCVRVPGAGGGDGPGWVLSTADPRAELQHALDTQTGGPRLFDRASGKEVVRQ